jgi:hypothetical protein
VSTRRVDDLVQAMGLSGIRRAKSAARDNLNQNSVTVAGMCRQRCSHGRRFILPDLGVNVSQIDPLINPVPDPVFAGIATFGRAIGCRHAITVRWTRCWRGQSAANSSLKTS